MVLQGQVRRRLSHVIEPEARVQSLVGRARRRLIGAGLLLLAAKRRGPKLDSEHLIQAGEVNCPAVVLAAFNDLYLTARRILDGREVGRYLQLLVMLLRQLLDDAQILLLMLAHARPILMRAASLQMELLKVCRLVRVGGVVLLERVVALILLIPLHDGRL